MTDKEVPRTPEEIRRRKELGFYTPEELARRKELGLDWEDPEEEEEEELEAEIPEPKGEEEEPEDSPEQKAAWKKENEEMIIREKKLKILNKIEKQVELTDFWVETINNPAWSDILRIYYRLNAGIVQKFFDSFTVKAELKGDKIEWEYKCYKDGVEIHFDATNEAKVKE